jgi:drug/metabolite transporter (DMT)-like permease
MNPVLIGTIAALCWGTLDFLAGQTSRAIGSVRTTAAVTIAGLVLLSAWLAAAGGFPDLTSNELWLPAVAGAGYALATVCLFAAISLGPVSLAVPIVMAYPATMVAAASLMGRVPGSLQLALIAMIMTGVVIAAWAEAENAGGPIPWRRRKTTIGLAILSHLTFLFAVFAGQKAAAIFGEIQSVWMSRLAGCLIMAPFLFTKTKSAPIDKRLWALLAFMGGLDVGALSLLFAAGRSDHPELAVVCASASGAVTVILARIVSRERILPLRWLGIAMTFAGIGLLSAVK